MSLYKNLFLRASVSLVAVLSLACCLSCGSSNPYGIATPGSTSGFKHRIFVTNSYAGTTIILNADNDVVYGRAINTISGNKVLTLSRDSKFTLQYSNGPDVLYYIDNTIEDVSGSPVALTGDIETLGILSDNATAVTASRNAPMSGQSPGAVFLVDLTNRVIGSTIAVPLARRVALNHGGTKVLAFADNTNTAYVIDTTAKTATAITDTAGVLDRPVTAIFSSDDSKAYILSCGAECGGTQAKVTMFDPSANALGNSVNVDGATMGILDTSGKLYIAGSTNGNGTLQTVDTSALASGSATPSTSVSISNGYHSTMAFADNNRLYVGSLHCSNATVGGVVQGCLTMYDTSGQKAVITTTAGDITGIQPIIGRSVVYVCQNGELVMYDATTDAPRAQNLQIDIVGYAAAVLQIS